jgi:hypothetical protein
VSYAVTESGARIYATEADAAADFDEIIRSVDLFTSYAEVPGTLLQPRPGQIDKSVRIDRILVPNARLIDAGWRSGIIGVEIKRAASTDGRAISQAADYTRSAFRLGPANFLTICDYVFIWSWGKQAGPLASVMAQSHVGSVVSTSWTPLQFRTGENNVLRVHPDGRIDIGAQVGAKVGSR